jgi:hypothetical protein
MSETEKEWLNIAVDLCREGHWAYLIGLVNGSIDEEVKKKQIPLMKEAAGYLPPIGKTIDEQGTA